MSQRGVVLLLGGVMLDRTVRIDRYPDRGDEATVVSETVRPGGSALNAAVTLRALGDEPWLVAGCGRDTAGEQIRRYLSAVGVHTAGLTEVSLATGTCTILVDGDGERTFLTDPGAQSWFSPEMVSETARLGCRAILLTGYFLLHARQAAAVVELVAELCERGCLLVFDPSPMIDRIERGVVRSVLSLADWVVPNLSELSHLARAAGGAEGATVAEQVEAVRAAGTGFVAVTRGGEGATVGTPQSLFDVEPFDVDLRDSTGAGDAFAAGLVHGLLQGKQPADAVTLACACGAAAAGVDGPHGGVYPEGIYERVAERQATRGTSGISTIEARLVPATHGSNKTSEPMCNTFVDTALGCLVGLAIGDAMGMPASFMTPQQIRETYGGMITEIIAPDRAVQEMHGHLEAGTTTDDTDLALIVAEVLLAHGGEFSDSDFRARMDAWARAHGMLESTVIGPSTRSFLEAIRDRRPTEDLARLATTNGAAMRVAAVGLVASGALQRAVALSIESARPSHSSAPALAAAAAIAVAVAAVSAAGGASSPRQTLAACIEAARAGEATGYPVAGPSVATRLAWIADNLPDRVLTGASLTEYAMTIGELFGASMQSWDSIPLALAVACAGGFDPSEAIPAVIHVGDDADTNAAIVGALCGAAAGFDALPGRWVAALQAGHIERLRSCALQIANLRLSRQDRGAP